MNEKKLILLLKLSKDDTKSKINFDEVRNDLDFLKKKRYISTDNSLTMKAKKKLNFFLEEVKW